MKKVFLLILSFSLLIIFTGCTKKEEDFTKIMKCSKKEPFNGTQIDWTNNFEVEYSSKDIITKVVIKHIIKVDDSVGEVNKERFKESVYNECNIEPGINFDLCDIKEEDNTYTVRLSTSSISLAESAITTSENEEIPDNISFNDLKELLEFKEYICTIE